MMLSGLSGGWEIDSVGSEQLHTASAETIEMRVGPIALNLSCFEGYDRNGHDYVFSRSNGAVRSKVLKQPLCRHLEAQKF